MRGYNERVRLLLAALLVVAACQPSETVVTKPAIEIILGPEDLPTALRMTEDRERSFDEVASAMGEQGAARLKELGFKGSRTREFLHRSPSAGATEPLGIFAAVTIYGAKDGAKEAFDRNSSVIKGSPDAPGEVTLGEAIGDESAGFRSDQRADDGTPVSVFIILFRFANVSNALLVSGVSPRFELGSAVDIAKKQLARQRP